MIKQNFMMASFFLYQELSKVGTDAKSWGSELKTEVYKFIDLACAMDTWLVDRTKNDSLPFRVSYDVEKDIVQVIYQDETSMCSVKYYYENNREVIEYHDYMFEYDDYNKIIGKNLFKYTKYVKDYEYVYYSNRKDSLEYSRVALTNGLPEFIDTLKLVQSKEQML